MTTEKRKPRCPVCDGKGIYKLKTVEGLKDMPCERCKGSSEQLKATIVVASSEFVGRHLVHNSRGVEVEGGRFVNTIDRRDVVLMAIVGGYAMVRRPRAMPYVASVNELEVPPNATS